MEKIAETKERLENAIEKHVSLVITKDGKWRQRSKIVSILRRLFGFNEAVSTAEQFSKYLNTLVTSRCRKDTKGYSQPQEWKSLNLEKTLSSIETWLQETKDKNSKTLSAIRQKRDALEARGLLSEAEKVAYDRLLNNPKYASGFAAEALLERSHYMLHYLGISQDAILSSAPQEDLCNSLKNSLSTWQAHHFPSVDYFSDEEKPFTLAKLARLNQYPEFAKAILSNHILRDRCFSWIFGSMPQDCIEAVDIFIQAPPVQKKLSMAHLDRRIQKIKNNGIIFTEIVSGQENTRRKDVSLLIHGTHQSITNTHSVVKIAEKISMTVKALFAKFRELDRKFIGLEYIQAGGIEAFDGRLTDIDFAKPEWWTQIPAVQIVSEDEIADRLGDGYALFEVQASRYTPELSVDETHAWFNLYVPYGKDAKGKRLFNCLSFGKFSDSFPVTVKEKLFFVFAPHKATITCVDPNKFTSDRERIAVPFPPLSKEQFEAFMEELKKDFQRSLKGTLVFLVGGIENCAGWVRAQIRRLFPDFHEELFEASVMELPLPQPLNPGMRTKKLYRTPKVWKLVRFLITCFCPKKTFSNDFGGKTTYRLSNDHLFRSGGLQLPSKLFDKLRRKSIFEAVKELSKTPSTAKKRVPVKIV